MEKKVLTLTVSKQWFDMIVAGEKTEEYREIKPYWIKRLTTNCEVAYDVAEKHIAEMCFIALTPMSSSLTVIARIAHESRRILRVSPSGNRRKDYALISGLVRNFLSLNSSSV